MMMSTSESTLQTAVMAELRWDSSINAATIGVSAHDGAVTLSGHVASYPERVAADKAARRIRGVVAIADELDVQLPGSWRRDDTDIAESLARALSESQLIDPGSVKATVSHAWVQLEGGVNWEYERNTAERIARHVAGVVGITNALTLTARPTARNVDKEIRAALHRRADLDARSIHVEGAGQRGHAHGQRLLTCGGARRDQGSGSSPRRRARHEPSEGDAGAKSGWEPELGWARPGQIMQPSTGA
jgi:osmotically-inducible protein OsmY